MQVALTHILPQTLGAMVGGKDRGSETTMQEVPASPFLQGFVSFLLLQGQAVG